MMACAQTERNMATHALCLRSLLLLLLLLLL
jgi:hypothetical protein